MATAPDASAQSFLNKVKRVASKTAQEAVQKAKQDAVNKAKQEVEQKTNLKETPEVVNSKPTARKSIGKTLSGKSSSSAGSRTLPFPKDHTALFAPLGYPCDPTWGTKQHTLSKPPHDLTKQPDWMSARPAEVEYDNASLVKAFKMLDECMETRYLTAISPAAFGFFNMQGELEARCKALDAMVHCYTEVKDEYEHFYEDGSFHSPDGSASGHCRSGPDAEEGQGTCRFWPGGSQQPFVAGHRSERRYCDVCRPSHS